MTTWKDGGEYGRLYREITNEDNSLTICRVRVRQVAYHDRSYKTPRPYPQGEANFALILQAPQMLAALEAIRDQVECYMQPLPITSVARARWESVRLRAIIAIAAAKGENDEKASLV